MRTIVDESLTFDFPDDCDVRKWDESETNKTLKATSLKAVDFVCLQGKRLYLIEVKDFNRPNRKKDVNFGDEETRGKYTTDVAAKFKDTLYSIWCGSLTTVSSGSGEVRFASDCRRKTESLRFVFHFESPTVNYKSGLFDKGKSCSLQTIRDLVKREIANRLGKEPAAWFCVVDCDAVAKRPAAVPWKVMRDER